MKKKGNARVYYLAAVGLLAGLYSFALFMLKTEFIPAQWVAYGFTMVSFALLASDIYLPKGKFKVLPMFGVSLSIMTAWYFAVQMLLGGLLLMFLDEFSLRVTWVIEVFLLAGLLSATAALLMGRTIVQRQETIITQKASFLKNAGIELEGIAGAVDNEEIRKELAKLIEEVQYSDPMSSSSLAVTEEMIQVKISLLRYELNANNHDSAAEHIRQIRSLLKERNRECLAGK